ncbi:Hypothetical protein, putative [Bodo saltans]|uniref:Uncharacterized protein n=1 Tax=Bodo saltans TaxID=75058 RepID=A0A0S4KM65_BODSA|nr:Hypothetical protein, putative [Bodo saltans]|eukprot:CUI12711.1 Hypothetical protein, putative [Bodo saltans]
MDRRAAMEAMVRLTHERCASPPSLVTPPPAVTTSIQRAPSPAMFSRDDVILSLKRAHQKNQRSRGVDATISVEADATVLPQLCSVVGQIPLHPPPQRAKSPTTPITRTNSENVLATANCSSPLSTLSLTTDKCQFPSTDIDVQLAGSLMGRPDVGSIGGHASCDHFFDSPHADDREHDRILRKAGYLNATDFENDDERQLAVAQAKKIATRRALHRSLHVHQAQPLPPSNESPHEFTYHTSTPPRKQRAGGQRLSPPPLGTPGTQQHEIALANALTKYSNSRLHYRSATSPQQQSKRVAVINDSQRSGGKREPLPPGRMLSPIPMPTSELVNRTLTMLEGIDSLSLTTTGGNCFRLSSDIQFSLKGSFR